MEKGICTLETWEDFKREIKRQFYPYGVAYLDRKNMRHLKHISSIHDYVKESNYVPIILGRPFLATSNTIINCRMDLCNSLLAT